MRKKFLIFFKKVYRQKNLLLYFLGSLIGHLILVATVLSFFKSLNYTQNLQTQPIEVELVDSVNTTDSSENRYNQ